MKNLLDRQRAFHVTLLFVLAGTAAGAWLHSNMETRGQAPEASVQNQPDPLEQRFKEKVQPILKGYCFKCHGFPKPAAELDLSRDVSLKDVVKNFRHWETVLQRLEAKEMPPEDAPRQPTAAERAEVDRLAARVRAQEAERHAGDPGIVLARRLSNAEFDYTIRDLTGVDIRPTREFPVDPANEAGFDNTGESLAMSPALLKKYLAAARPRRRSRRPAAQAREGKAERCASPLWFSPRIPPSPTPTATSTACSASSTFTNGIRSITPIISRRRGNTAIGPCSVNRTRTCRRSPGSRAEREVPGLGPCRPD